MKNDAKGFTLIELLIVIAIIAILALIAVPNFMEAQTRAKVSRVKADMRSIATTLEAYYVDHNTYPVFTSANWPADHYNTHAIPYAWFLWIVNEVPGDWYETVRPLGLTTPIAYMTNRAPDDPFMYGAGQGEPTARPVKNASYFYYNYLGAANARARGGSSWVYQDESSPGVPITAPLALPFNGGGEVHHCNWALVSCGPSRKHDPGAVRNMLFDQGSWDSMKAGDIQSYDPSNGTVSVGGIWRLDGGRGPGQ